MKKQFLATTCALLSIAAQQTQGQTNAPSQTLSAPAADQKFLPGTSGGNSSLGSIYSPSLYDGSANISIPIYEYNNGFGISISYNTKGVKVDAPSGLVGNTWNFNAGGSISRVVKDIPDEANEPFTSNNVNVHLVGRFWNYRGANPSNPYTDGENDDYMVSAGPLQFTFKMGPNGYVFTHPQRRYKIEFYKNGTAYNVNTIPDLVLGGSHEYGFRIIDDQGNQYYFDPGDITDQYYDDGDPQPGSPFFAYTSRWVLTKVIFDNGQQITFDYESNLPPANFVLYRSEEVKEYATGNGANPTGIFVHADATMHEIAQLTAIHYPNNITASLEFDQAPPAPGNGCSKSLKEIRITADDQCLRYRFNKKYLLADAPAVPQLEYDFDNSCNYNFDYSKRMVLKGIDIVSCDGTVSEPYYSFEYSPVKLPPRLSARQDFFGYGNGVPEPPVGTMSTIPYHPQVFQGAAQAYGNDRSVATSEPAMSAGNLYKINNAYGGSVTFQYELHSGLTNVIDGLPLSDPQFLAQNADDGLRLKAITEADKFHPGDNRTTLFIYSGGQRFLTGGYFSYPAGKDLNGNINQYNTTGTFVSPHQLVNGSNHGYSQVTVETRDGSTNLLSKTVYQFSNFKDNGVLRYYITPGSKHYYQAPFSDKQYIKDWELGQPLVVTQYDQDSNIISRTTNHYTSTINTTDAQLLQTNVRTMKTAVPANSSVNILNLPVLATDSYLPYTGLSLLDTTITLKYIHDNSTVNDTATFKYDSHNNQYLARTRNSRGQYIYTRNVYNYEVSGTAVNGGADWGTTLFRMTDAGLEKVVSTERWKEMPGTAPYSHVLLDASITGYQYDVTGRIWTNQLQTLQSNTPIGYTAYTGSTAGTPINPYGKIRAVYNTTQPVSNLKQASIVLQYDSKGNPLETQVGGTDVYKAMLWDTIRNRKIAEAANTRYTDIGCTSFENTIYGVAYTGNENIVNGRFSYKQMGVTMEDSVTGSYCYKLTTAGQASVISTPQLTQGKEYLLTFWSKNGAPLLAGAGLSSIPVIVTGQSVGGWNSYQARFTPSANGVVNLTTSSLIFLDDLRLMPSGSSMNSWTYGPLFGIKTATDASGRVVHYERDALGRVVLMRDREGHILSKTEYHIGQ